MSEKNITDFVTAKFSCETWLLSSWGTTTSQVLLSGALLQSGASQEPVPVLHLPSCEADTVNSPCSLGGWKRDSCGALSNCTWHMVLRCAREDGWQSTTLLWFFCLLPLSSMKIARDINAEEPEKKWNGKTESKKQALPTQLSKQTDLLRLETLHKLCCCWCTSSLNNHSDTKESFWSRQRIRIRKKRRTNPVSAHDLEHVTPLLFARFP